MTQQAGQVIDGRYTLESLLGRGGFGVVWKARDQQSGQAVAVKFLRGTNEEARRRFAREREAMQRVQSPYCIRPIDSGSHDGQDFLVSQFIDGVTLDQWGQAASVSEIGEVVAKIAEGLGAAHREGVVHRDLKPSNIMVTSGPNPQPAIIDFGLARFANIDQHDVTKTGAIIGTAGFMSPEQLRGDKRSIGPPTDMYALGVVLFQLLQGHPPFVGDSPLQVAMQHLSATPPAVVRQPAMARLVADLLSKDPARRPTAAVVVNALTSSRSVERSARVSKDRRPIAPIALVVLVLAAAIAYRLLQPRDSLVAAPPALPVARIAPATEPAEPVVDVGRHPEVDAPAVDAAAVQGDTDLVVATPACASNRRHRPVHIGTIETELGAMWIRVPPTYDGRTPHPAIVMFHDGFQEPRLALKAPNYRGLGELDRFVVIAVLGNPFEIQGHWRQEGLHEDALAQFDASAEALCLDPKRIFALGFGHGGIEAYQFAADRDVAAVATFAWIPSVRESAELGFVARWPPIPVDVPLLTVSVTDDPVQRYDGRPGCTNGLTPGVEAMQKHLAETRGCSMSSSRWKKQEGGKCVTLACEPTTTFCVAEGGRLWPTGRSHNERTRQLLRSFRRCRESVRPTFEVSQTVWSFFQTVSTAIE